MWEFGVIALSLVADLSYPKAMAVLGDSMSEALLSGFSLENPPSSTQIATMMMIAASYESKEARIAAFRKRYAKHEHSWATGTESNDIVLSHFERLREVQPDLKSFNFAVSGAESKDLNSQVEALIQTEGELGTPIDYITLLMGANDLGSRTSDGITPAIEYIGNIENNLRKILDRDPERAILIVGLPKIHEVFERSQKLNAYKLWSWKISCGEMRQRIYGGFTIFKPDEDEPYQFTKTVFSDYIKGLEALPERLSMEYPRAMLKTVSDYRNPVNVGKALSIDCFHPSEWGQAELAEITWAGGFWPEVIAGPRKTLNDLNSRLQIH